MRVSATITATEVVYYWSENTETVTHVFNPVSMFRVFIYFITLRCDD